MSDVQIEERLVDEFHTVEETIHRLNHEQYFYDVLDGVNDDNKFYSNGRFVDRYGAALNQDLYGFRRIGFQEWRRLTPRKEFRDVPTFDAFLELLNRQEEEDAALGFRRRGVQVRYIRRI